MGLRAVPVVMVACLLSAISLGGRQDVVHLAVEGRANATPWADARGSSVAVAWGAALPGGKTDVFVAVSRDSGATFGPPVRVNAIDGEARLGGELPPRVTILPPGGGRDHEIVVAYGAKNATTEIKAARSSRPSRCRPPLRPAIAAGTRWRSTPMAGCT
jgi:hypothetical protein